MLQKFGYGGKRMAACVITSYSIHYTKLYDNERGDKAGAADAYRSVSNIHKRFKHARLAEEFAQRATALEQEG